jgi:hypothetical protein
MFRLQEIKIAKILAVKIAKILAVKIAKILMEGAGALILRTPSGPVWRWRRISFL